MSGGGPDEWPSGGATRRGLLAALSTTAAGALAGCQAPSGTSPAGDAGDGPALTTVPSPEDAPSPYARVYRSVRDSVAVVRTDAGQGSCFAYDDDGHFVTNHHVVAGASEVHLHYSRDEWDDASVVATDVYSDLAVLAVEEPPDYAAGLDVLEGSPAVGQEVVVLGTPFGFQGSVTTGVVSGIDRALETATGFPIPGTIQTDAAVNPGNSGGPMLALDETVLGVVSAGGGENIAFGIPPQLVNRVVPSLLEDGEYRHPYMGVRVLEVDPQVAAANDLERPTGVIVVATTEGGPAAGTLRGGELETIDGVEVPVGGDVVVGLDDREITSMAGLSTFLSFEKSPGEELAVTVLRDGTEETVTMTLGERPPPEGSVDGG